MRQAWQGVEDTYGSNKATIEAFTLWEPDGKKPLKRERTSLFRVVLGEGTTGSSAKGESP